MIMKMLILKDRMTWIRVAGAKKQKLKKRIIILILMIFEVRMTWIKVVGRS